jgi:glutamyl-tRNA synthetase
MTVTRFAPSPTGYLHVGNLRTALLNRLVAARDGGGFVLRLDDTDAERSRPEFAAAIREDLAWVGIEWDREVRQAERLALYRAAAERLEAAGRLYECFETPQELALRRRAQLARGLPPVYDRAALGMSEAERARLRAGRAGYWRFRLEHERTGWEDGILGPVEVDAASVSDPVLVRADGQVLYTLASVVDDLELGITDVVRGADHVTNTATQVQIMQALGGVPPRFAHHSLLTGPGGEALSKRTGALSLRELRAAGVEPVPLVALVARLGTGEPVDPAASLGDLAADFALARFGAAPTRFDPAEPAALTARYLHGLGYPAVAADLAALGVPDEEAAGFWGAVRGNVSTRAEIGDWWAICRDGAAEVDPADADFVAAAIRLLPEPPWGEGTWAEWTGAVKAATGRKGRALFRPLRRFLTGREHGPEMAALMPYLHAAAGRARR